MVSIEDLYTECKACKNIMDVRNDFVNRLASASNYVSITTRQLDNDNKEIGEEIRVSRMIEVNCRVCMNKRRLLTETGKKLMELFRDEIMVQD